MAPLSFKTASGLYDIIIYELTNEDRGLLFGLQACGARLFIEAGADVNARVHSGRFAGMTSLTAASRKILATGHMECIRLLQAAGAME